MIIHNSLGSQPESLEPLQAGKVGMYVCGMTVYDYCHLGHARVLVAFDVVARYLRQIGYDLTYVRNITDVDDKIIRRAAENGESVATLTERFIAAMHEDEAALGVRRPDIEPRATAYIASMLKMIATLVERGAAYVGDNGDVYFAVLQFPDYGKLSRRKLEDLVAGARVEVSEVKRDPLDFVLWKSAKPGEISWDSPFGPGRPGWHIECSAMSADCLGKTFDIHGGGPDLKFPHHENEIAQSESCHGAPFARIWMHAGAVRVNKEKMSKSLGNFFTIREILQEHPAEVLRFFLVSSHYRSAIDYSPESLAEARAGLLRLYTALAQVYGSADIRPAERLVDSAVIETSDPEHEHWQVRFDAAMQDDFATPAAIAILFELARALNLAVRESQPVQAAQLARSMVRLGQPLGLLQQHPDVLLKGQKAEGGLSDEAIEQLVLQRQQAKKARDYAESDRIRDALAEQGVLLKDGREGTTWERR